MTKAIDSIVRNVGNYRSRAYRRTDAGSPPRRQNPRRDGSCTQRRDDILRIRHRRTRVLLLAAALLGLPSFADVVSADDADIRCTERPHPIIVSVSGHRSVQGTIKAKLYGEQPEEFMVTGKKLDAKRVPISRTSPVTTVCLYAPAPGTYAIVIHHDENGNKKFDRNWIGLPLEGYGFSNNPELLLGPPAHHDVSFSVDTPPTHMPITLQY